MGAVDVHACLLVAVLARRTRIHVPVWGACAELTRNGREQLNEPLGSNRKATHGAHSAVTWFNQSSPTSVRRLRVTLSALRSSWQSDLRGQDTAGPLPFLPAVWDNG
ncbi:hypothetical protein BJ508DRAFT_109678 [Ascobolus immersus RN42]|uniref:Secreted protein n=1 Tax=Ascobolus immersus RN42 TaxID=1160509 RepID=A0A3N4I880_ASCIM|nr:hypothetical protein BJ508DRAFT_109678 [Ascobolus immersus RN42]